MNNEQIIANIAIETGYMTKQEVEELQNNGEEIPLHTVQGWSKRGYNIKPGEHGVETKLWRKRQGNNEFYLTKSFLFRKDQLMEQ